jgi:beta-lactamase regulating signal transducer with metallopeptidase domain
MTYAALTAVVATASFAVGAVAASLALWLAWPSVSRRLTRWAPAARARAVVMLRLLPVVFAAVVTAILFFPFHAREPRTTLEHAGVILTSLSTLAVVSILAGITRWLADVRRARTCQAAIRTGARCCRLGTSAARALCIDTATPLLALVGGVRPVMVVSRGLLEQVTDEEIELMVRHELAHRHRGDNLVAALLHALPDPLAFTRRGRQIAEAWRAAAEEAADDAAAGGNRRSRLVLAGALVRLAQTAHVGFPVVATSLLLSRSSVERRLRRLVDDAANDHDASVAALRPRRRLARAAVLAAIALVLLGASHEWARGPLYALVETAVSKLP